MQVSHTSEEKHAQQMPSVAHCSHHTGIAPVLIITPGPTGTRACPIKPTALPKAPACK